MTDPKILLASLAAAYLYVVTPGPAFLALFTLAASRGRASGAWFICGHLVGDVTWGALAVAAIIGANRIGPTLFELLGFVCGLYLLYLGARAVMTKKDAPPRTIGAKRPLATGMAFGLTNPKSYPVALAMFSAIVAPYIGALKMADAPQMFVAAFAGFLLADVTLIFAAGLPAVRRFFLTHGVAVTRLVGVIFICSAQGLYLLYLGARAVMTKKDAPPATIGAKRPLATGMAFGLTNPKSYPVALAMFSAIVAPYIGALKMADGLRCSSPRSWASCSPT